MGASGYCLQCGTTHTLPTTPEAKAAALKLVHQLEETGRIDLLGFDDDDGSDSDSMIFLNPATFMNEKETAEIMDTTSDDDDDDAQMTTPIPTTVLTEKRGKMMGVLLCDYGDATIVLCAFAGAIGGTYHVPGWVPPVGNMALPEWTESQAQVTELSNQLKEIQQQVSEHHAVDNNDTERIIQLEADWNRLREKRVEVSRSSLAILRSHQVVNNFRGERKTLEQIYMTTMDFRRTLLVQSEMECQDEKKLSNRSRKRMRARRMPPSSSVITKGMPVGVGECCATKLFGFASQYNQKVLRLENNSSGSGLLLRPVGIAEFFFGTSQQTQQARDPKVLKSEAKEKARGVETTSSSRTKQVSALVQNDGVFFDACELRCQPVLGFMMCGVQDL
jgi:Asp-tRNA(Asn)/Glu-tRNA(Gln) amidotransferase C subunit